jgi:hypothetical protein
MCGRMLERMCFIAYRVCYGEYTGVSRALEVYLLKRAPKV